MEFDQLTSLGQGLSGSEARTVAIAGADDEAAIGLVDAASGANIHFILVGDAAGIRRRAKGLGVYISDCSLVSPEPSNPVQGPGSEESAICRTAARLCSEGKAGVLMKGHVGTAAFTRSVLDKEFGLTGPDALLSHVGLFDDPRDPPDGGNLRGSFLLTDGAINIAPDLAGKKIILANAVAVARALGTAVPRIALLAPVEKVSPKIASTVDAAALTEWVEKGGLGDSIADGPFALDVAACAHAAEVKGLSSPVAGRADIYLAPNLDTGNVLYKALTVFARARAAGLLAGARVPVVLTSRSDGMEVKLASLGFALNVAAGAT